MEEKPFLPPNYVSLRNLQEKWLNEKQQREELEQLGLPPNYVSLRDLQERSLKEKHQAEETRLGEIKEKGKQEQGIRRGKAEAQKKKGKSNRSPDPLSMDRGVSEEKGHGEGSEMKSENKKKKNKNRSRSYRRKKNAKAERDQINEKAVAEKTVIGSEIGNTHENSKKKGGEGVDQTVEVDRSNRGLGSEGGDGMRRWTDGIRGQRDQRDRSFRGRGKGRLGEGVRMVWVQKKNSS